jgi:hypothetical protein
MTGASEMAALAERVLTKAQSTSLIDAVMLLDHCAGEGLGMDRENAGTLWADDVVVALADAFGIEWDEDFLARARAALAQASSDGE